ncbi:MAG: thiamine phosphate synthase [Geminicoccaceae bacterium]
MTPMLDLSVYAVLDPSRCHERPLAAMAEACARGGATLLQYRDKLSSTRTLVAQARAIKQALAPYAVPLLINDRVDVALAAAADGVHLGQEDMGAADARKLLGPAAIIGVTAHFPAEADGIDGALADYAGMGPVFETGSKQQKDPVIGPDGLAALIGHLRARLPGFPVCGIAGVDHSNAHDVIAAGADGVAVISDIFMAEDVEAATRRLADRVHQARRSLSA